MVKHLKSLTRLLLALAVAGVVLLLGTCALFTDSLFPWYLSGVTDTLDLSTWIDDELVPEDMSSNEWGLDLAVLRDSAGVDRVFVAVFGYEQSRLIILDSDLSLSPATAPGENPIDGQDLGRRALVDANGRYVIGLAVIDPGTLEPEVPATEGRDEPALSTGSDNYGFWVDNGASPVGLFCRQYTPPGWSSAGTSGPFPVSADLYAHFDLQVALYDGQRPEHQRAVLLLRKWGEDEDSAGYIVYLNEAHLGGGIVGPVIDSYPGFTVTPRRGVERMRYTRKGVVVREGNDDCTLYRFSEEDSQSLSFGTRHDVIDAYDIDGEYFYMLDKDERMLYKGRTGW